eukprot:gene29764-48399_t
MPPPSPQCCAVGSAAVVLRWAAQDGAARVPKGAWGTVVAVSGDNSKVPNAAMRGVVRVDVRHIAAVAPAMVAPAGADAELNAHGTLDVIESVERMLSLPMTMAESMRQGGGGEN